ncbi:MAG: hypothetical protein IJU66_07630 [Oscillospiraceae bacterium]|nr:hypothetical protein [Oscillospiraceae bacterium]
MDGKSEVEKEMARMLALIETGTAEAPPRVTDILRAQAQDMSAALRALVCDSKAE